MQRRDFIAFISSSAAVWSLAARAQSHDQVRVGLIARVPPTPAMLNAFRDGMRERGYVEGQNLAIEVHWPRKSFKDDPTAVADLVKDNVDVIVAWATPTIAAVRRGTSTIPIVMVNPGDPVGSGFIASLARPGGNITGLSGVTSDLSGKLVGLLVEMIPTIKRMGVVSNSYNQNVAVQLQESENAVRTLGLDVQVVDARTPEGFERGFASLKAANVGGVMMLADPTVIEYAEQIAQSALAARLPTAFQRRENVEVGGLFSYGTNLTRQFKEAAFYVDRILKGAKPAELPVQEAIKFEFVINLKTAKALGITVPPTLVARADDVIE